MTQTYSAQLNVIAQRYENVRTTKNSSDVGQFYHRCQEERHHRQAEAVRKIMRAGSSTRGVREPTVPVRPEGRDGERGRIRHLLSTPYQPNKRVHTVARTIQAGRQFCQPYLFG